MYNVLEPGNNKAVNLTNCCIEPSSCTCVQLRRTK